MAENDQSVNPIEPASPPLADFWMKAIGQAAENAALVPGRPHENLDPQAWRRLWFDTLSRTTDAYLRSPLFLQMLKAHIEGLVHAKRLTDVSRDTPRGHNPQLTSDVKAMRLRLEQLQRRLKGLEEGAQLEPTATGTSLRSFTSPEVSHSVHEPMTGATGCEIVYEEGLLKLWHYSNDTVRFAEPIVVCFALVNRPYILDLKEERSVVQRLIDGGFDVYLIDWGVPADADGHLTLDDYICSWLSNVVGFVCDRSNSPGINLLGYCMGGTMATMFTALQPDRVRNLILMAAPIDFGGEHGLLNLWAREDYFNVDQLIDAYGNCPGQFLQFVFQLMKPVQNFAEKQLTFCENLNDAAFVDNFVAVERWANDSIPVAGETFRQYVKSLYQQNLLIQGRMQLAGQPVRLEAIECPLLLLVAEKDHLVPPDSTLALLQFVNSKDTKSMSINAGHVGLAVSSKAHRQLWPEAARWIGNHSTKLS